MTWTGWCKTKLNTKVIWYYTLVPVTVTLINRVLVTGTSLLSTILTSVTVTRVYQTRDNDSRAKSGPELRRVKYTEQNGYIKKLSYSSENFNSFITYHDRSLPNIKSRLCLNTRLHLLYVFRAIHLTDCVKKPLEFFTLTINSDFLFIELDSEPLSLYNTFCFFRLIQTILPLPPRCRHTSWPFPLVDTPNSEPGTTEILNSRTCLMEWKRSESKKEYFNLTVLSEYHNNPNYIHFYMTHLWIREYLIIIKTTPYIIVYYDTSIQPWSYNILTVVLIKPETRHLSSLGSLENSSSHCTHPDKTCPLSTVTTLWLTFLGL